MASSTHRAVPYLPLARMTVSSSGTGNITLAAAVSGYLTFDLAGASTTSTGHAMTYAISDGTNSEVGRGVYYSSSLRITRDSSNTGYLFSTNGNSPIAMSVAAQVFATLGSHDLYIMSPTYTTLTASAGTYTPPTHCVALELWGTAGGAGGYGDGGTIAPTTAGDTYFIVTGGSTLRATGAGPGRIGGQSSGANILNMPGSNGSFNAYQPDAGMNTVGGDGGDSYFGRGGRGNIASALPGSLTAGSLGGGGGAGGSANNRGSPYPGGGAGGTFWHKMSISSMSSALAFTYSVGRGTAGSAGTDGGSSGAEGGDGILVIKEYYH